MTKEKKPRVRHKPGQNVAYEEAETKAIEKWLRVTDKPLVKEKPDRKGREPGGQ